MRLENFATEIIEVLPIRRKTQQDYQSILKCHVYPKIGKHQIESITRLEIQSLISELNPPIASKTLAVLKTIFREAIARELLETSILPGIKTKPMQTVPRRFLRWDELRELDFGKYDSQIHFLATHGVRWSEALALTSEDFRDGRIFVNKSIHGDSKSASSVRIIPQVTQFATFPRSPKTLRKVLNPYGVCIHSLRHTYAYLLKQQGVHVTTAQRLLGHSDSRVTLNIYTQVLDEEIDKTGALLRSVI